MGLPQPWLCAPLPFAAGCRVLTNRPAMSVPKQKPVFSGIEALRPDTSGWNLVVKVGCLVGRGSGGAAGTAQGGPGPARGAPTGAPPRLGAPRSMRSDGGMRWGWAARRAGLPPPCGGRAPAAAAPSRRATGPAHNLTPPFAAPRQVVDAKVVVDKPARGPLKPQKVAECTVGDASGVVLLTARNEQGALWVGLRLARCCSRAAAVLLPSCSTCADGAFAADQQCGCFQLLSQPHCVLNTQPACLRVL